MKRATRPATDAAPCVLRSTETRNASQGLAEALQDLGFLDDLGHPETTSFGDFDPGLPVIIMTGLATRGEIAEARRLGVTEIIEKPEVLKRFSEALTRVASLRRP